VVTYRADALTALGDPTRRDIFERLGTRRIYRVDPDGLEALRAYLDHFWDQALAGYRSAVERAMKESE
jgi:hypothetical protein